jgi:hypothetical protein
VAHHGSLSGFKNAAGFSENRRNRRDRSGLISEKLALFIKKSVLFIKKMVQKSDSATAVEHFLCYFFEKDRYRPGPGGAGCVVALAPELWKWKSLCATGRAARLSRDQLQTDPSP